jgi:hypothetical protein
MFFRLFILGFTVVCAQGAHAITQAEELAACAKHVLATIVRKDNSCTVPQVHGSFSKPIQQLDLAEGSLQQGFADIVKENLKDPTINGWRVSIQGRKIWMDEADAGKLDVCLVFDGLKNLPMFEMPDVEVLLVRGTNMASRPFLEALPMFPNLKKVVFSQGGLRLSLLMQPDVRTMWYAYRKSTAVFLLREPLPQDPTVFLLRVPQAPDLTSDFNAGPAE